MEFIFSCIKQSWQEQTIKVSRLYCVLNSLGIHKGYNIQYKPQQIPSSLVDT